MERLRMPEFDIDFAAKLAEVADQVYEDDWLDIAGRRVTVYLSRLSAELTMKALLEQAGVRKKKIRMREHSLKDLLNDLGRCQVEIEGTWVSASVVRDVFIDLGFGVRVPIGHLIDGEGTSHYPNRLRYGATYTDFHPAFMSTMAVLLAEWAKEHWRSIRLPP